MDESESMQVEAWKETRRALEPDLEFIFEDLMSGFKIIHDVARYAVRTALFSHLWKNYGRRADDIAFKVARHDTKGL